MTQEKINKVIKKCYWLTDNMSPSAMDKYREYRMLGIECDTLKKLFKEEKKI